MSRSAEERESQSDVENQQRRVRKRRAGDGEGKEQRGEQRDERPGFSAAEREERPGDCHGDRGRGDIPPNGPGAFLAGVSRPVVPDHQ